MTLNEGQAAAPLEISGREVYFCSQPCLQTFVGAPDRYV
jgi:YHS domain-containing protein